MSTCQRACVFATLQWSGAKPATSSNRFFLTSRSVDELDVNQPLPGLRGAGGSSPAALVHCLNILELGQGKDKEQQKLCSGTTTGIS